MSLLLLLLSSSLYLRKGRISSSHPALFLGQGFQGEERSRVEENVKDEGKESVWRPHCWKEGWQEG